MKSQPLNRRTFVQGSTAAVTAATLADWSVVQGGADAPETHQAMGTRVGEVTATTAVVWTRLTANSRRNHEGVKVPARERKKAQREGLGVPVEKLEGACPGMEGQVRLCYGTREDLKDATTTEWVEVGPAGDFIHQFQLKGLKPATVYHYASETTGKGGKPVHGVIRGKFETAPKEDTPTEVVFCVMTCQGYHDRGHADGHAIYPAMLALRPQFALLTGDLVYYDNDAPRAVTPQLARYHWERMFSLPRLVEFNRNVGTYWLKDDHDTVINDSWPGKKLGQLTFAQGQAIFREQAPLTSGPLYRTIRWGRDLQIWLSEGRDYRTPNNRPDGPDKTIWGAEQKAWFKRTVKESTATWKVLISPTPLVGPDRQNKNDNHSNRGFRHEGDELRAWLKRNVPDSFFVICGDRHWQYHSVHPQTGLHEFSVGAASDEHAGGSPGLDKKIHRFHRVKGGFLTVTVRPGGARGQIRFEHRDVKGKVVHSWSSGA